MANAFHLYFTTVCQNLLYLVQLAMTVLKTCAILFVVANYMHWEGGL